MEENDRLCSELWVSPCGATGRFGRVHIKIGGGALKHKLWDWESLLLPAFFSPFQKPKAALSSPKQNDKHLRTNTEEMHRKQVVSLFIIITIVTINCVINAIQQLCKQAVSDAVSYLQYEDNNNDDVFTFVVVMDLVFPGILSLLQPPSPRLHRNWFHSGWRTGLCQVSSFISVHPETSYLKNVAFFRKGGENTLNVSRPDISCIVFYFSWNWESFSHWLAVGHTNI